MSTKHTATPWFNAECSGEILDGNGELLADAFPMSIGEDHAMAANAAFIVKAVNSHEQLVAALKEALAMILEECADAEHTNQVYVIRAALAAAGEQP